jgi:uncharacterized protein YbaP (TraB family)
MTRSEFNRRLLTAVARDHKRIKELEDTVDQLMQLLEKHSKEDRKK